MPKKKRNSNDGKRPIATTFQIVEAYKTVRTNLLFALAPHKKKIVLFSSAEPNAGKTTASSNIAIALAQTDVRVLLIDADMRKPSQHLTFRVNKNNGLSRILTGDLTFSECVLHDVARGMDLLPSGIIPPNPSELLGSEAMDRLLEEVGGLYDYVVIDTPPIGVVADSLVLCEKAAGTVLITRQGQTTYDELRNAINSIKDARGNLLGVVISDMKDIGTSYGRYSRYKYYKAHDYSYSTQHAKE